MVESAFDATSRFRAGGRDPGAMVRSSETTQEPSTAEAAAAAVVEGLREAPAAQNSFVSSSDRGAWAVAPPYSR